MPPVRNLNIWVTDFYCLVAEKYIRWPNYFYWWPKKYMLMVKFSMSDWTFSVKSFHLKILPFKIFSFKNPFVRKPFRSKNLLFENPLIQKSFRSKILSFENPFIQKSFHSKILSSELFSFEVLLRHRVKMWKVIWECV